MNPGSRKTSGSAPENLIYLLVLGKSPIIPVSSIVIYSTLCEISCEQTDEYECENVSSINK